MITTKPLNTIPRLSVLLFSWRYKNEWNKTLGGCVSGRFRSSILLAKAADDEQKSRIGNQTGVEYFFLHTDDFSTYYSRLKSNQVRFVREPVQENWGMVAVFQDVYGNLWDLIQPAA